MATFGDIDRPLRKQGLRPEAVIEAMPAGLLVPFQAGRPQPIARDEVQLTLRGVAACVGGQQDIDLLLRLLPWLAERELEFEPLPDAPDLRVLRSEIAAFLRLPVEPTGPPGPITRLRHMLAQQRWAWSGGELADGEWYVQIDRNIYRFTEVGTLDEYLDVLEAWDQESKRPYVTIPDSFYGQIDGFPNTPVLLPESQPYVPAAVVADLTAAAATSSWECTKLLALIDELNDSYGSGKTYASHALLRAILDHVPPLLGRADFAGWRTTMPGAGPTSSTCGSWHQRGM